MTTTLWLRAETKSHEARTALTPETARELIQAGFKVVVEDSVQSAITTNQFADAACEIVEAGSWESAPEEAWILGLKELPDSHKPLRHRHIYFAHAYKNQTGWEQILSRFIRGGGKLFDIEYLVEESGRRVAAFGYWAGYTGCAVGVKTWIGQQLVLNPVVPPLSSYSNKQVLVDELREELNRAIENAGQKPTVIIIGAKGRVGTGASDLAAKLGLEVTGWDMAETAKGGPFPEVLTHDIFVNCVLVNQAIPPFITPESLSETNRKLGVISDVSCDPFGPHNPVPLYSECTTFDSPTLRITDAPRPLDLIAIDHLPSMLPAESSEDFARQLLPHLLKLDDPDNGVWNRALEIFKSKSEPLRT